MSQVGFEPTTTKFERVKRFHALDGEDTVIGRPINYRGHLSSDELHRKGWRKKFYHFQWNIWGTEFNEHTDTLFTDWHSNRRHRECEIGMLNERTVLFRTFALQEASRVRNFRLICSLIAALKRGSALTKSSSVQCNEWDWNNAPYLVYPRLLLPCTQQAFALITLYIKQIRDAEHTGANIIAKANISGEKYWYNIQTVRHH